MDLVNSQIELRKRKAALDEAKKLFREHDRARKQIESRKHNYEQRLKDDQMIAPKKINEESKDGSAEYQSIKNLVDITQKFEQYQMRIDETERSNFEGKFFSENDFQ